ncbi:hypothetical protein LINGRAHAP2_LOCUS6932 [Linum grandiflorum]
MLLSAVGKDGNNQMYPIVWAVVENENRSSWTWFISILQKELGFADGTRWSVISDQHKVCIKLIVLYGWYISMPMCLKLIFYLDCVGTGRVVERSDAFSGT